MLLTVKLLSEEKKKSYTYAFLLLEKKNEAEKL